MTRASSTIDGLTRRHGDRAALDDVSLSVAAGAVRRSGRPVGIGQDDPAQVDQPPGRARRGRGPPRRPRRARAAASPRCATASAMSSRAIGLFPHMNVAENIGDRAAADGLRTRRATRGSPSCSSWSRCRPSSPAAIRARCRAARRSASASPGRWPREPKLMLMDEPFGALDPVTRDALGRAYRALHDRLGLTTLMVTHDIAEALLLADRIVVLIDGRIRADAHARRAARRPADPEVQALIEVPRRQAERLAPGAVSPALAEALGRAARACCARICCSAAARSAIGVARRPAARRSGRRAAARVRTPAARPGRPDPDHAGAGAARALLSDAADPRRRRPGSPSRRSASCRR